MDKAILHDTLSTSPYDVAVFADDSNKKGEDRHMVGIHTWSSKHNCPVGYLLADTLVTSGKGEDQAKTDHHVLKNIYGIQSICGVVGDNASTQSGGKKGQAVELGALFKRKTVFIGCYPHILNIALRAGMTEGFGHRGQMSSFNLFQLHYKIGYVHHQKPSYYKSLYVSEKILSKPPPLPQEFVETRWTYIHENLTWYAKYGDACLKLGQRVLQYLPKKDGHFTIWEEILKMAASPVLSTERVTLLEVLDRLIIPALKASQQPDRELQFSSGYLARNWPSQVLQDIYLAKLMKEDPEFAMPLTSTAMERNMQPEMASHYRMNVLLPFTSAVLASLEKHGTRWFKFPLFFSMGADTSRRHLFWRAYCRLRGLPVPPFSPDTFPALPANINKAELCQELLTAATSLKCPFRLAEVCYQSGLLDRQKHLLQDVSCHWFRELEILALLSADDEGLKEWITRWPISAEMHSEIEMLAQQTQPSVPAADREPHMWMWFSHHVFALPVNNVLAERQFNLANIHLTSSDSEISKQATHLFVENVLNSRHDRFASSRRRSKVTGTGCQYRTNNSVVGKYSLSARL